MRARGYFWLHIRTDAALLRVYISLVKLAIALLAGLLFLGNAHAQRVYDQAELDAMLAPIALQPDGVVSQVLIAATYPDEVAAAARWSRANPHMRGDPALRAVENEPWDPAVKALVAFPELLTRMVESPQWLHDLGEAFVGQQAQVMDTVQALRRRAQAAGHLASTDQTTVYDQGEAIVVQPRTQIVYVNYYDPYVVYGSWWWPYYRPVFWHPWAVRPVFVAHGFFYSKPDWHHRHVNVVHRPVHVQHHHGHKVVPGKWQPHGKYATGVVKPHGGVTPHVVSKPYVRVPESQRKPIVQQHMPVAGVVKPNVGSKPVVSKPYVRVPESQRQPIVQNHMPAASGFTQHHAPRQQHAEVRPGQGGHAAPRQHQAEVRHGPQGGHAAGGHSPRGGHGQGGGHSQGGHGRR